MRDLRAGVNVFANVVNAGAVCAPDKRVIASK
jgi:hypothetical protein